LERNTTLRKTVSGIIFAMMLVGILTSVFKTELVKSEAITQVSIVPSDITVGKEDEPLPTSPFTINITVNNVTDLYAWQTMVYYNPLILKCNNVTYPPGHVFDGKNPNYPTPDFQIWNKTLLNETTIDF